MVYTKENHERKALQGKYFNLPKTAVVYQKSRNMNEWIRKMSKKRWGKLLTFLFVMVTCISCGVYSFKDVSIPPEVKTVKIGFIENRARYIDPQLSPRLTDRVQQKITNQTRLTRTNNDDAHYQISGYISDDNITTAGISNQQAATNRLTIAVHIIFRNTLNNKTQEFDISRNFDFAATLSRQQAEQQLNEEILKNLTDDIFNRIFSNW